MKQLKLFLSLIVLILMFVEYAAPSIKAQTDEPATTVLGCHLDYAIIFNMQFSSDGKYLVTNWPPNAVRIWNAETSAIVATLTDPLIDDQEKFDISPDNKYIVTGGNAGVVIRWELLTGKKIQTLKSKKHQEEQIKSLSFSPNGNSIMVTYRYGHILWDLISGTGESQFSIDKPQEAGLFSAISPDGKFLLTQSSKDTVSIRIWDITSGKLLHTFNNVRQDQFGKFSPDGGYILIPRQNDTILADTKTYNTAHILDSAISDWQFSPDGKYLLATKKQSTVFLWDVEQGKQLHEFTTYTGFGLVASFLNNKSIFFATNSVGTPKPQTLVSIRDIKTGAQIQEIIIGMDIHDMQKVSLAPSEKYFAISGVTGFSATVTAWGILSNRQIHQYC